MNINVNEKVSTKRTWRDYVPTDLAKPRVSYFRSFSYEPDKVSVTICSKLTWCVATVEHQGVAYVGVSKCHAEDSFSRKKGKNIAVGRATRLLGTDLAFAAKDLDGIGRNDAALFITMVRKDLLNTDSFPELMSSTFIAADKVKPFIVRLRALEAEHFDLDGEIGLFLENPEEWSAE